MKGKKVKFNFRHSWITKVLVFLVVFLTSYSLILPAVTLSAQEYHCGFETEHTHTEECYAVSKTAQAEESEAEDESADSADGKRLLCDMTEHKHTDQCFSDPEADLEDPEVWADAIESLGLSEDPAENAVLIAKSQIGTRRSAKNYLFDEETQTRSGISRYGQWEQDPYEDWNVPFVRFCLSYAGFSFNTPSASKTSRDFMEDLASNGWNLTDAPEAGDVAFYRPSADSDLLEAAVVAQADEQSCSLILADGQNSVHEVRVDTKKAPELVFYQYSDDSESEIMLLAEEEAQNPVMPRENNAIETDLASFLTSLNASNTKYNEWSDDYKSDFSMQFKIPAASVHDSNYILNLDKNIVVPDSLLGKTYIFTVGKGQQGGTYYFEKAADGHYQIHLKINEDIIEQAEHDKADVVGHLEFKGIAHKGESKGDDGIDVKFSDNHTIHIPGEEIEFPSNVTNKFDIHTQKSGALKLNDTQDYLEYEVRITSNKGTPDPIHIEDILKMSGDLGLDKLGTPEVSVEKETYPYDQWGNKKEKTETSKVNVKNADYKDGKLTFDLEGLNVVKNEDGSSTKSEYVIKYRYPITGHLPEGASFNASNSVKAEAQEKKTGTTVTDKSNNNISQSKTSRYPQIAKGGWYDSSNQSVKWTLTVNENKANAAGYIIKDDAFLKLKESDFQISPNEGYEFVKEAGKITGIRLTGETNLNRYSITYSTPVEGGGFDEIKVQNTASVDNGTHKNEGSSEVTVSGASVDKRVESHRVDEEGNAITNWLSEINMPLGTNCDLNITDTLNEGQWITKEQLEDLIKNGVTLSGAGNNDNVIKLRFEHLQRGCI